MFKIAFSIPPKSRLVLTTALIYSNGDMHIGHLSEAVFADIFARYRRATGQTVIFVGADDCHGTPIELKAESLGITPDRMIHQYMDSHRSDYAEADISYDVYHLTHSPENKKISLLFYERLRDDGHLVEKSVSQLYDPKAKRFLDDRRVRGTCPDCGRPDQYGDSCDCGATYDATDLIDPVSTISGAHPELATATHLFFPLKPFKNKIGAWLDSGALQPQVRGKLREWMDEGLRDWCITRTAPYFGFNLPDRKGLYLYVWLDAPIGYIAALQHFYEKTQSSRTWKDDWQTDSSELIHIIGKDIVNFHGLFWPAVLMANGCRLPDRLHAHGFVTIGGEKMSKSRQNFVTAKALLAEIDPEALRWVLASRMNNGIADFDINANEVAEKVNADLVGKISNIAVRLKPIMSRVENLLSPALSDSATYQTCLDQAGQVIDAFEKMDMARAVRGILGIADSINTTIDRDAPWNCKNQKATRQICTDALAQFRVVAVLLQPICPQLAARCLAIFGENNIPWKALTQPHLGHVIDIPARLFERINGDDLQSLQARADKQNKEMMQ